MGRPTYYSGTLRCSWNKNQYPLLGASNVDCFPKGTKEVKCPQNI